MGIFIYFVYICRPKVANNIQNTKILLTLSARYVHSGTIFCFGIQCLDILYICRLNVAKNTPNKKRILTFSARICLF